MGRATHMIQWIVTIDKVIKTDDLKLSILVQMGSCNSLP